MPRFTLPAFIKEFRRCDVSLHASALAFHTLLSLIPLSGMMFWLLSSSGASLRLHGAFHEYLVSQLNIPEGTPALRMFDRLSKTVSSKTAGVIGMFILIFAAWALLWRLGHSIDVILETRSSGEVDRRKTLKLIIRRILVFCSIPISLFVSLTLSSWILNASFLQSVFKLDGLAPSLRLSFSGIITYTSCFLVYYLSPRVRVSPRQAARAALFATVLLEIAKTIVSHLGGKAFAIQKMYGALAAMPLLMIWLQVVWTIILSGVLIIQTRTRPKI